MKRLAIILLLAGCTDYTGEKFEGGGDRWKLQDARYCETYAEGQGHATFGGLAGLVEYVQNQQNAFDLCMMNHGYHLPP